MSVEFTVESHAVNRVFSYVHTHIKRIYKAPIKASVTVFILKLFEQFS